MHKLSQNLGKISKNQPKLEVGRFFFGGQNIGPVRRAGEEKRMDSNNIHLRAAGIYITVYHHLYCILCVFN